MTANLVHVVVLLSVEENDGRTVYMQLSSYLLKRMTVERFPPTFLVSRAEMPSYRVVTVVLLPSDIIRCDDS